MTSYVSANFAKEWLETTKKLNSLCDFISEKLDKKGNEDDFLFNGEELMMAVVKAYSEMVDNYSIVLKMHEYAVERERSAGIKEELITKLERF